MFDDDILDENNEVNDIQFQSRRKGGTAKKVNQPKNESAMDYGDLEFSEEDNKKNNANAAGMKNSSLQKPGFQFEDSLSSLVMQQKQQQQPASRQLSALPPIQQNNPSGLTSKAKRSLKSSKILDDENDGKLARINTGKKKVEIKNKEDESLDDLDDLDDIYAQSHPEQQASKIGKGNNQETKNLSGYSGPLPTIQNKQQEEEKNKEKQQVESDNYEDDYEKDDYEKDDFDQEDKNQNGYEKEVASDKESELSDLPELHYEEKPAKKVENNNGSSNRKETKPVSGQRRESEQSNQEIQEKITHKEQNYKPPQGHPSARTNSQSQNRQKMHNNSQQKKFALFNMRDLDDLLEDKQYTQMSLNQIKAENEQLREKLREFNKQLSEKIEHSQVYISQEASEKRGDKLPRSRSNQMRTADAESENNHKIMKRLREELERLQQRLSVLEDPSYVSTLKLQIETSKSLINKFRLQIKQISFKNDQQSKELERISQEGGVHESVREGYILKQDVQQSMEKLHELQNKKEELEDLFKRKNDLLQIKEEEYNKKHAEALALGLNTNLSNAEIKRREKYQELLKNLEQWEKSNATLAKMNKIREGAMLKELDTMLKFIQEKDSQINDFENEIFVSQGAVQERVDNEKLYSKNVKELLGRLDNAENHSLLHNDDNNFRENNSSIESTSHKPNGNNMASPSPQKTSSKPNMKLTKQEYASPLPQSQQKPSQHEVVGTLNEPEKGINFHKKIQHRQDVSSDREQPTEVSSKPFSFKKGQEKVVWKPQEEDNNKINAEQPNNDNNTQSGAKSFNFKHKNDVINSDVSPNPTQQYQLPQKINNSEEQSEQSSENSSFSKPAMFKFKKTETIMEKNNSSQDQLQQPKQQQQVSSLLGEDKDNNDDIGFSMNSRISKNRATKGRTQQSDNQLEPQYNPIQTKLSNIQEEEKVNTQGSFALQGIEQNKDLGLGGYQFSAMKEQPSGVTRRRGQNNKDEEKNTNSDLIGGGYQPSSNVNKPAQNIGQAFNVEKKEDIFDNDDDFGNNLKSRRGRNHQVKKEQDDTELNLFGKNDNIKPYVPKVGQEDNKLNSDNAQKKQPDNEWDFGSLANPTVAPQKTGLNNNANSNFNALEEKQTEAPKTFNFKRNQQANAVSPDKPQESQPIKLDQNKESAQKEVPSSNIERNRGGVQQGNPVKPEIQKKEDDDVLFMGPSERRRVKKPNVQDQGANTKVIKRDVFQDNENNNDQPFNFAAPKEVGITSTNQPQNRQQQNNIAKDSIFGDKKKSALDDDLDGEAGLDFLKEKKQKVNYNDDDDDLFGAKPSKVQQAAPVTQKKNQKTTQGREKKLISKAQDEDFFNDLM